MRVWIASMLLVVTGGLAAAGSSDLVATYGGRWSGSFAGANSGTLVVTLSPSADGHHTGAVAVTTNDGTSFEAQFKTLTLEQDAMRGAYDVPDAAGR